MRETLHGKECTCVVIFYALEDCLQAMSVLGHNDFIFRHEWEVTNNIRSCNWTLLLFCSPFIIYIKQPIFLWPPLGRTGFRGILLWGCFCNRGTSASSASKTLSTHSGSNLQFPLMNQQHWVDINQECITQNVHEFYLCPKHQTHFRILLSEYLLQVFWSLLS